MNGPFVANAQTKEVHNLNSLQPDCGIVTLTPKQREYFYPDQTIDEIKTLGYSGCKFCIK